MQAGLRPPNSQCLKRSVAETWWKMSIVQSSLMAWITAKWWTCWKQESNLNEQMVLSVCFRSCTETSKVSRRPKPPSWAIWRPLRGLLFEWTKHSYTTWTHSSILRAIQPQYEVKLLDASIKDVFNDKRPTSCLRTPVSSKFIRYKLFCRAASGELRSALRYLEVECKASGWRRPWLHSQGRWCTLEIWSQRLDSNAWVGRLFYQQSEQVTLFPRTFILSIREFFFDGAR